MPRPGGATTLVGMTPQGERASIDVYRFVEDGKRLLGSNYGSPAAAHPPPPPGPDCLAGAGCRWTAWSASASASRTSMPRSTRCDAATARGASSSTTESRVSEPPPVQRPPTARPRSHADDDVPPGAGGTELAGMERGLVRLVELAGAMSTDEPALGATLLTWPGRGPAFNHATRVRWSADDWQERAEAIAERLRGLGGSPVLIVAEGPAQPADLVERLRDAGWLEIGGEVTMWTRRAAAVPHLDAELRLEAGAKASADEYEAGGRPLCA